MYLRFFIIVIFLGTILSLKAQIPDAINYQALVRDANGNIIANRDVNVRLSVMRTLTNAFVYREIHNTRTNEFGLINLVLGKGQGFSGSFTDIRWENAGLKLRVETDINGGFYEVFGESDFQSVPYALGAEVANSLSSEARISTGQITASGAQNNQILRWNGNAWVPSNESVSTIATSARLSGNGSTGSPLDIARQGAVTGQVLKWNGNNWAPADESTVSFGAGVGITIANEQISANANEAIWNASQLRGRNVSPNAPSSGQVLSWDGNNWAPSTVQTGLQLPFDGNGGDALNPAIRVTNSGGVGLNGRGTIGVRATATGQSPQSVALELQNGGIRVTGTNRAAFRVGGEGVITINSPLSNDNPNALIYLTQLNPDPIANPGGYPFSITYDFTTARWIILSDENISLSYNVLIINQ